MEQRSHSRNSKNKDLAAGWFSGGGLAGDQLWHEGGNMEGTVGNGARMGVLVWRPSGTAGGPWVKANLRRTGMWTASLP